MTDAELEAYLELLMCSDPWPTKSEALLKSMANREAMLRGYKDWIAAYHKDKR